MIQAYELTANDDYLAEALKAIEATRGLHFDINYQANLTAWGAAACVKLHRLTGERFYLEQAYVFFASFLHNCEIWESEIGHAVHYRNFLGATALHDAHYMAIYECFDSFAAMKHMLADGDATLSDSARMLASEYCKYALDRAWYYYPDALPPKQCRPSSATATAISIASSHFRWKTFTLMANRLGKSVRKSMAPERLSASPPARFIRLEGRRSG
ncbi:hypothetical protein H9L12_01090 [Sphingomonas rhizophila]|uniref:Uncharacterized protein n=1 Tax=Sphingomonas rhizophila TaxID=2071607 RepID=A0A7G9SBP9_9SPHN|nr:hypothetical protein [Sphingomonas rhizophila]QNN65274.1 hypothetical protein H9L12_01090 [Sphingomonas rhizophila]